MKPIATIIFFLLVSQSANADCDSASGPHRVCYDNTNAPPEVVYRIFVRTLFADSLEDEEDRKGWHYVEAGLTANMSSADVIHYFVPKYIEISKEVEEAQKRTLCLDRMPRFKGAENFFIFNQLEEVSLNIYEKHLYVAKSDLSASGLFDLDKALSEFPGSFADMFMDHNKARGGSVQRIYEVATALCEKPWGHHFSSSRNVADD